MDQYPSHSPAKIPELLAPAGDPERLKAAVQFGADAVYLGGEGFTMRTSAKNFSADGLCDAVRYCHEHGVKVYLTCNTLPRNHELDALSGFLAAADRAGVDALIVADLGIMQEVRRQLPEMEMHISTQAGVVNYASANALYALGAKRVVLARELSLEEIAEIRQRTPPDLELEVFVHGAMCMSFSGRCLLSDYLAGRDANRGDCAQPCRWRYRLLEEKRPGEYFPIFEDDKGSYILNARDLRMIEHLDELMQAGVSSLKIEGRGKSTYYTAVITGAYRAALKVLEQDPAHYQVPAWALAETEKVSHRPYNTGFYFGRPQQGQDSQSGGYLRQWEVAAVVEEYREGRLYLTQRGRFFDGDMLEALEPGGNEPHVLPVREMRDESGEPIRCANRAMMRLSISCPFPLAAGSLLRIERPSAAAR